MFVRGTKHGIDDLFDWRRAGLCGIEGDEPGDGPGGVVTDPPSEDPPSSPSFLESLPEELREDPAFANIEGVDQLAREHVNLQSLLGRKGVVLPKDGDDDDRERFYNELGRPDTPDDYEIAPPEGGEFTEADQVLHAAMRPAIHAAGLRQDQLDVLRPAFDNVMAELDAAREAKVDKTIEDFKQQLSSEHGDKFAEVGSRVQTAAKGLFGEQFEDAVTALNIDGVPLLDHPLIFNALNKYADLFSEHGSHGVAGGGGTEADIDALKTFEQENREALTNRSHPDRARVLEERARLYKRAYPEKPNNGTVEVL